MLIGYKCYWETNHLLVMHPCYEPDPKGRFLELPGVPYLMVGKVTPRVGTPR